MSTTAPESQCSRSSYAQGIMSSLQVLESLLDLSTERLLDPEYFAEFHREFLSIHASIRIHHAAAQLCDAEGKMTIAPEWVEEFNRLRAEHSVMIGHLDRLIRSSEAMADQTMEDKDVFLLRVRELIAFLRRHQAEDDRLFYLSVWRDTGGES